MNSTPLTIQVDTATLDKTLEETQHKLAQLAQLKASHQLVLRFYDWRCGHHGTRPDDLPVSSSEQATAILLAMNNCIHQPGHFRAWLMDSKYAVDAYVTDNYVSTTTAHSTSFPTWSELNFSDERPLLIYGTEEQIAELRHPDNAKAVSYLWFFDTLPAWDGASFHNDSTATTTLTLAELENITRPHEWFEPGSPPPFARPPIFKTAESALEEVKQERASTTACSDVQTPVPSGHHATNTLQSK